MDTALLWDNYSSDLLAVSGTRRRERKQLVEDLQARGVPEQSEQFVSEMSAFDDLTTRQMRGITMGVNARRMQASVPEVKASLGDTPEIVELETQLGRKLQTWERQVMTGVK